LSSWDKSIDLYVLADHMPRVDGDRLALFKVKFLRVRSLRLENDAAAVEELSTDEHLRWRVHDFDVHERDGWTTISLWGLEPSPRVEIVYDDLDIQSFPLHTFDDLFPGWTQPRRGLARPGPDAMMSLRRQMPEPS